MDPLRQVSSYLHSHLLLRPWKSLELQGRFEDPLKSGTSSRQRVAAQAWAWRAAPGRQATASPNIRKRSRNCFLLS